MRVALCCLAIIAALVLGVGIVSHGIVRHIVQTAPFWPAVVLGLRRREAARWCAFPGFVFWLVLMVLIWLFLLGWSHVVSGTFTPVEIAMTVVVAVASIAGIVFALRQRTATSPAIAAALLALFALLQFAAFRISVLPGIGHD
ncbi:MAG: hypothetical protein ABR567_04670 [Myxococcales bacterium]